MLRKSLTCAVGALMLTAVAVAPAGASSQATPVSGSITCGLNGTMTFKKPLPNATLDATVKNTRVKIKATIVNCDNSGVLGGKLPITGGTLEVSGILEEDSSCSDLSDGTPPDFTFDKNSFSARWTGGLPTDRKHPTVGKSKAEEGVVSTGDLIFGGWEYDTDVFRDNDSFAGEAAIFDLAITNGVAVSNCALGKKGPDGNPANLSSVNFTADQGSTINVSPDN